MRSTSYGGKLNLEYISQFTMNIQHISGKDGSGRVEAVHSAMSFEELNVDKELKKVLEDEKIIKLTKVQIPGTNLKPYCNRNTSISRPYGIIPKAGLPKLTRIVTSRNQSHS